VQRPSRVSVRAEASLSRRGLVQLAGAVGILSGSQLLQPPPSLAKSAPPLTYVGRLGWVRVYSGEPFVFGFQHGALRAHWKRSRNCSRVPSGMSVLLSAVCWDGTIRHCRLHWRRGWLCAGQRPGRRVQARVSLRLAGGVGDRPGAACLHHGLTVPVQSSGHVNQSSRAVLAMIISCIKCCMQGLSGVQR